MPKLLRLCVIAVAAAFAASTAFADSYPAKPIRMIVPLPPGSASDVLARTVGTALSNIYKQQIVIDNRPGAGGLIGSTALVNARADGYTLALVAAPHLAAPLMQSQPPYRPLHDVTPVVHVASIPGVLIVAPTVPAKTLQEFVALIKAKPGELNYASFGVGTVGHLSAEILNSAAGLKAVHVPFKELGAINNEMANGRVHYFVPTTTASQMLVNANTKVRPIAVTSTKRSGLFPEVPTMIEAGLPAAQSEGWFGVVAPAGLPKALVAKLNTDVAKILSEPDIRSVFSKQDAVPADDTSPAAFAKLLASEHARYESLIKKAGLRRQ